MNKKNILILGNEIYDYFKKNKTYPKSVKVNGENYNIQESTSILSKFILNPSSNDIAKQTVKGASNPNGDRINRSVVKKVYLDMCKRLNQFIAQNKQLPNYVTIDGKQKCSIILFILQLSKIVAFYDSHKILPSKISINSDDLKKSPSTNTTKCTNPYMAKPYNSASGCDNMGQNTGYFCAPSMLQKMLYRLGIKISQSELARVMGTTSAGTSHSGIETAIAYVSKKFNVKLTPKWYNFSDLGYAKMGELMCKQNTAVGNHILYRNQYGHYEYPLTVNTSNNTIKVINSLGNKCNSCYCGYIEERSFNTHKSYLNGISQKSVLVLTKG